MHPVDYGIIIVYLGLLLWLGLARRLRRDSSAADMILGGRMLTLPAFVASLVSTWYGGILGVGEYSFKFGLSNWLVFGLPYYLAAALFAIFLARRARESELLTIPQRLGKEYDDKTALAGATIIFVMTASRSCMSTPVVSDRWCVPTCFSLYSCSLGLPCSWLSSLLTMVACRSSGPTCPPIT
jgi:Na+/proline symporter